MGPDGNTSMPGERREYRLSTVFSGASGLCVSASINLRDSPRSSVALKGRAAKTIRAHLWGIIDAIVLRVTNAGAESLNAKIQRIKSRACGFRTPERHGNAIYFHCGGLDLLPDQFITSRPNLVERSGSCSTFLQSGS